MTNGGPVPLRRCQVKLMSGYAEKIGGPGFVQERWGERVALRIRLRRRFGHGYAFLPGPFRPGKRRSDPMSRWAEGVVALGRFLDSARPSGTHKDMSRA